MVNAGERKDVRKLEKVSKRLEQEDAEVLNFIMSTTSGRSWIWRFLESCEMFNEGFSGDALSEAYLKGRRSVGLSVFAQLHQFCPDQYLTAAREANVRRTAEQLSGSKDANGGTERAEFDGDPDAGVDHHTD